MVSIRIPLVFEQAKKFKNGYSDIGKIYDSENQTPRTFIPPHKKTMPSMKEICDAASFFSEQALNYGRVQKP